MGPKQERGRATAQRVLEAAQQRIEGAGPGGLSIEALVEGSGASVGSIYHHFGNLDGVYAAVYGAWMASLLEAILEGLASAVGPEQGIDAMVKAYLGWTARHAARARFIHACAFAPYLQPMSAQLAAQKAPLTGRILLWFQPYVDDGRLVRLPPSLVEMLVIGPVAEVARRWLSGDTSLDLDEAAALLPARIFASLAGPERR